MRKQVLVIVDNGFEEVEALTVVDYLRRVKTIYVDLVSANSDQYVIGAHDIVVKTDNLISQIKDFNIYDAMVVPGGMPGASNLRDNTKVIDVIKKMNNDNKLVAAICAGPIVLEKAGVLKGRKVTSYPSFEKVFVDSFYLKEPVVLDKNIITSRGPTYAVDFALAIIEYLTDIDESRKIATEILLKLTTE